MLASTTPQIELKIDAVKTLMCRDCKSNGLPVQRAQGSSYQTCSWAFAFKFRWLR